MTRDYDSLVLINSNEISSIINYRFPKATKTYDQGQRMLFTLDQYSNDHGYINLSQMI